MLLIIFILYFFYKIIINYINFSITLFFTNSKKNFIMIIFEKFLDFVFGINIIDQLILIKYINCFSNNYS